LSNAFDYALERKLIASNECYGLAQKIKTPKSLRKTEDSEIKAFTKEERDLIINAFRTNPHRLIRHYADYVEFCFYTGARPCEVAALQWKHITSTHIKFEQDLVESETEKFTVKQGLKTQEKRQFPINPQLQAIVDSIRPDNVEPDAFVFLSSNGNHINLNKFSQRSWKTVLKGLKESHNIQPLSPYHTRHTFITMMIDNGVSAMDIKRWCGNSADIVLSRYASAKRDLVVPEM
jgi:integrase